MRSVVVSPAVISTTATLVTTPIRSIGMLRAVQSRPIVRRGRRSIVRVSTAMNSTATTASETDCAIVNPKTLVHRDGSMAGIRAE